MRFSKEQISGEMAIKWHFGKSSPIKGQRATTTRFGGFRFFGRHRPEDRNTIPFGVAQVAGCRGMRRHQIAINCAKWAIMGKLENGTPDSRALGVDQQCLIVHDLKKLSWVSCRGLNGCNFFWNLRNGFVYCFIRLEWARCSSDWTELISNAQQINFMGVPN